MFIQTIKSAEVSHYLIRKSLCRGLLGMNHPCNYYECQNTKDLQGRSFQRHNKKLGLEADEARKLFWLQVLNLREKFDPDKVRLINGEINLRVFGYSEQNNCDNSSNKVNARLKASENKPTDPVRK
jgi:hypothetical protein